MKNGIKKVLLVLMAAALIVSMTACAGSEEPTGQSDEQVELLIWLASAGDINSPAMNGLLERFETAYPNIKVTMQIQPNDNYDQLLKAAHLAQNGPDIEFLWVGSPTLAYKDDLVVLNDYLDEEFINDRFGWELATEGYGTTGNIYGVPMDACMYFIWYNKDMFADIGIDETNLPETWDELLDVCEQLKSKDITPFVLGTRDGYISQWGAGSLACTLMGKGGASEINREGFRYQGSLIEEAFTQWQQLGLKGYINTDNTEFSTGDVCQQFILEKGAMLFSGNWDFKTLHDALGDKLGVMKVPSVDPNSPYAGTNYSTPGRNYCVSKYSDHIEEAITFIKFAASDEQYMIEYADEGWLPTFKGIDSTQIKYEANKLAYEMLTKSENGAIMDCMPHAVFQTMVRYGSEIANGDITPQEYCALLDEAAAEAN